MSTDTKRARSISHGLDPVPTSQAHTQPGKYSIERILALEEYSRTKSIWHVLAVILVTPLLPLIGIIAYEMPPLQPIEAGWQANWVFFSVRLGVGMMIVSEGGLTVARHLMPELTNVLRARVRLAIAVVSAVVYVLTASVLAQVWGFPVPFTTSLVNPTGGTAYLIATIVVVRSTVATNVHLTRQFVLFCCFVSSIPVMTIAYPAYMSLFLSVDHSYQPVVMLLVPVIKILFRKLISRIMAEWEDLVPIMVIFSIELFNSLYQVVCVQSGGSMMTTAAVMTIDLLHTIRSQIRLHHSTTKLQKVLNIGQEDALLSRVCALCEDAVALKSSRLQSQEILQLRLRSALSCSGLSDIGRFRLESIEKIGVFSSGTMSIQSQELPPRDASRLSPMVQILPSRKVFPWRSLVSSEPTTQQPDSRRLSGRKMSEKTAARVEQSGAIVEAAKMLFRSEYLLLGEYLECIIPLIYATNLVVLWLSPNGAFYPHTRAITNAHDMQSTLAKIAALFLLEIGTFAFLVAVLWKRLRFSPLHQLSFVLENQASMIQVNMFVFLVLSSQFNLDHAGADFSFQFKWLDRH